MRLILLDRLTAKRFHFYPLALSRPIWELRCGMSTLGEKLVGKLGATDVACFVPPYMAEVYRESCRWPVNDPATLVGDDLLIVHGRVKAQGFDVAPTGPSRIALDADGECLYARITRGDLATLDTTSLDALLDSARQLLPSVDGEVPAWSYTWDLILANPDQLREDFAAAGRSGIEGTVEQPSAIRGSEKDVYVARGALVHPMVVIDAAEGPVYIDEEAEIHPFTRIEGPSYIGKKSILFGAKCREGNSIGPVCRVGGEIEESIIHGYSNKYHDGFLGHAYVGEWVNLGALTTNSDLKNDYSTVEVILEDGRPVDTGSTKVGSLIGDHTKTSIGTLFNTGANVGAMAVVNTTGMPLPKFIPSFAWLIKGAVTKGRGKRGVYETAEISMGRRKVPWTPAHEAMWNEIFELTAEARSKALKRGRIALAAS
ncbi:MAG TPA: putative sugar nucleotidyl transferase [Thermoguttaceae bacterium]|nr:putative sugar nucleotidyl transferase [Thermoguttaceae bacterium]